MKSVAIFATLIAVACHRLHFHVKSHVNHCGEA
jgi:hypothetical protein